jgi:parvulin-like peptidyl-prolyl isomerase
MRLRALFCVSLCLSVAATAAAEVIDRILAVVNGSIVTLSDVQAASRFGLVAPDPKAPAGVLEQLIDRRLMVAEVDRYGPGEPPPARVDEAMAGTRRRFDSDAAFDTALRETGQTAAELRRQHRDALRVEAYIEQRFGSLMQPSEDEILAHYRAHEAKFTRAGVVRPYDEVRSEVRAALVAERRADAIREWIAGLRRRADVSILPTGLP